MKDTRTYQEDETLSGYVMDLQSFDKLLKQAQKKKRKYHYREKLHHRVGRSNLRVMTTNKLFRECLDQVSETTKAELNLSFAIADRIDYLLKRRG